MSTPDQPDRDAASRPEPRTPSDADDVRPDTPDLTGPDATPTSDDVPAAPDTATTRSDVPTSPDTVTTRSDVPTSPDTVTTRSDVPTAPLGSPTAPGRVSATPVPGSSAPSSTPGVIEEDLRTGAPPRPVADTAPGTERVDPGPRPAVPPATDTAPAAAATPADAGRRARTRPESVEPPSRPGFGRHVLGVLVGLVLTPFAFLLTGIGGARLADIAGTSRMGTDTLGVVLLATGVALLAVLVLLGAWTATVPITGGLVWGLVLGIAYLVAPRRLEDAIEDVGGGSVPAAVDQFAQSAMSGLLLVVGVLLLAAGVATAMARRAGRRYGSAAVEHELATRRREPETA